jgi:hypothetical protein
MTRHDQVALIPAEQLKDPRTLPAPKRHDPPHELPVDAVIDPKLRAQPTAKTDPSPENPG